MRTAGTRVISPCAFLGWCALAFVTSFGLVWLYVAVMPMAFLDRDYPLWIAKRTMLDECRLGTVAVFGDSRTLAATLPSVMSVSVLNFALSGTSPVETYFAVRRALRCPTPPKLVVIAHGALKFSNDSDYWVFGARTGFLSYGDMREVDGDAAQVHDDHIELLRQQDQLPTILRERLFSLRFPAFYFDSLVNGVVAIRWRHNRNALHDALRSSGHAFFGTALGSSGIAAEGHAQAYQTSPLVDLYFSRTLALLAQRGVPVYFLSMPLNQATYDRTPRELKEQFGSYLLGKQKEFPGLHVVGALLSCWPDRFFGDAWHFNALGASEYSRVLGELLRNALTGGPSEALPDRCTDDDANASLAVPVFAAK